MRVQERPLDQVIPYEGNPRVNDDAVPKVAESIREFGWQQPIVVDADGVIIAGHTRYKAAQELGLATVPVVVADGLTAEQAQAYRLADNKTAELADWDDSLLAEELDGLLDFDMERFGFDGMGSEFNAIEDLMANPIENIKEPNSYSFTVTLTFTGDESVAVRKLFDDGGREMVNEFILREAGCR